MYDPREVRPLSAEEQSHAKALAIQEADGKHLSRLGILLSLDSVPPGRVKQSCFEVLKARLCEPEIVSLVQAIFAK